MLLEVLCWLNSETDKKGSDTFGQLKKKKLVYVMYVWVPFP